MEAPTTVLLRSYMFNGAEKKQSHNARCPAAVPSVTTREPQRKTGSCAAKPRMGQPFMVLNVSGTKKSNKKTQSLLINNLRLSPRGCNQFKHIREERKEVRGQTVSERRGCAAVTDNGGADCGQDYRIPFYYEMNSIDSNSMCFSPLTALTSGCSVVQNITGTQWNDRLEAALLLAALSWTAAVALPQ